MAWGSFLKWLFPISKRESNYSSVVFYRLRPRGIVGFAPDNFLFTHPMRVFLCYCPHSFVPSERCFELSEESFCAIGCAILCHCVCPFVLLLRLFVLSEVEDCWSKVRFSKIFLLVLRYSFGLILKSPLRGCVKSPKNSYLCTFIKPN